MIAKYQKYRLIHSQVSSYKRKLSTSCACRAMYVCGLWGVMLFFGFALKSSNQLDSNADFGGLDDKSTEDYDYDYFMNYFSIFPGTKWCGSGDVATDENDLGSHLETDSCCRAHDKCPDVIEAGQSKHGLTNHAPYTRLNCECDDQFLNCLRNSKDDMKVSQVVGTLYFDLLRQKCYKLEHKITGCKNYNSIAMRCEKYSLDLKSPKSWQWFDVPVFNL